MAEFKHILTKEIDSGLSELNAPYMGSFALRMKEYVPASARLFAEISTDVLETV